MYVLVTVPTLPAVAAGGGSSFFASAGVGGVRVVDSDNFRGYGLCCDGGRSRCFCWC